MKLLLFPLLLMAPMLLAQIPSRTLPEVGCGPVLLIGVKDYDRDLSVFDPLPGIGKDLERMEATVRALGFTDITVLKDPSKASMLKAMNAFGKKVSNSEKASLFYYSGHGVSQDELNYLIPAKAQVLARGHLKNYAVPFEHVTGFVGQQTKGPCLFFIDACRNNTLPAGTKASRVKSLLIERKGGVFVGFATGEGQVSAASVAGSPYTESLSKHLLLPGASLDDLYFNVIADVEKVSKEEAEHFQPPEKVSGLRYRFVLVPGISGESIPSKISSGTSKVIPAGDLPQKPSDGKLAVDEKNRGKHTIVSLPLRTLVQYSDGVVYEAHWVRRRGAQGADVFVLSKAGSRSAMQVKRNLAPKIGPPYPGAKLTFSRHLKVDGYFFQGNGSFVTAPVPRE